MRLFGREDLKANAAQALEAMNSGKAYELVQKLAAHA
jgi:anthranilate phosphoribosyltransferase